MSEAIKGGLQPRGTVAFADLPQLADCVAGWMFNISDEFTTTADFKEGAGNTVPAGANIYKTSDKKWDVLAGTPVTGVKGAKEASYRRGNVNLTPANIGAVATGGDTANNIVSFTSSDVADGSASAWTTVSKLSSGEKHSSIFAKVSQMFKNVRYLYKMLGTTDISKIGNGTCTGAISSLSSSLGNISFTAIGLSNKSINVKENYSNLYISKLLKLAIISIDVTKIPMTAYNYTEILNISGLFTLNDVTPIITHFADDQLLQIIVDKENNVIKVYGDKTCVISRIRAQIVVILA